MSQLAADDALGYARSLLQARLLSELFADRVESFVLKGGMAMRVRHESARATQDIDLDADFSVTTPTLQGLVRRAIRRALAQGGLENVEITEPKQTEVTARWKIRGFDPNSRQSLLLTIEVSRRDQIDASDCDIIDFSPTAAHRERPIRVYNNRALAFTKVKALLGRDAPRDIADLFLLIRAEVDPPIAELSQLLQSDNAADVIATLWNKIDSMDEARFKSEVLPSLPADQRAQHLYQSWEQIRLEVGLHVERWIEQAKAQSENPEACDVRPMGKECFSRTTPKCASIKVHS